MAQRIFPTKLQDELGSKLEFNGINIDTVVARLAESQEDKKTSLSPELLEKIAEIKLDMVTSDDEDDDTLSREAKKEIPEAFKEHMFKKKTKDDESEEESDEEKTEDDESEEEEIVKGTKKAESRKRRIRFTSASQLTPEAAVAAKEQGDEELYRAILSARSDVRAREAQKLIDLSEEALKREATAIANSKRQAYRMKIVSNEEQTRKSIASANVVKPKTSNVNESPFKTVKSMTDDERDYFKKIAASKGMPEEYIASMFGTASNDVPDNSVELSIRDIMASNMNEATKKFAIDGLVKTASLDKENINRLKKYWKEELGYGDEEWIDDLFTTKYDK